MNPIEETNNFKIVIVEGCEKFTQFYFRTTRKKIDMFSGLLSTQTSTSSKPETIKEKQLCSKLGMGDTRFFESRRYRYDTNDFLWYRYQISIPIPVNLSRIDNRGKFYLEHNDDFPFIQFHQTCFQKKLRIFQLFLRFDWHFLEVFIHTC